jgi:hypothetical protein
MKFLELPKDLKNIVSGFAYDCKWEIVEENLRVCKEIRKMQISIVFTREIMWSAKYRDFIPNPLRVFEPICNFTGLWADYIDWHAVQELLWRLDFRRKFVKLVNSRKEWRELFRVSWRNIEQFDNFYNFLLYTRVPCFKPLWEPCGFDCLKSFRSPYLSARWWVHNAPLGPLGRS